MNTRSNFLRVSAFVVIAAIAAFSVLGSAKASLPAQATTEPTVVTVVPTDATVVPTDATVMPTDVTLVPTDATVMPTVAPTSGGGTGGTGDDGGAVATATLAPTFDESAAFPPCPEVVMPTMEAATDTGAEATATPESTVAATMEATMDMGATMDATMSATMDMPAPEGTTEATPVVGTFEEEEGCSFQAVLSGENERPDPGDPDGEGMAVVTLSRPEGNTFGQVCFEIEVSGITLPAVAAHIHRGTADVAGPIVVPLSAPDQEGIARGCTTNVNRGTIRLIVTNPSEFYVNVHTTDFPKGAVRGQLTPLEDEDEGTTTP